MGIAKYLDEALKDFDIYGEREAKWQKFERDIDYDAFIVRRKIKIL